MNGSRISSDVIRIGQFAGRIDAEDGAVGLQHLVGHRRRGLDHLDVELALEALLDDLHVQQAEESAAETEAQRVVALRLEAEAGVVERKPIHRIAQFVVLRFAAGIEIAIDHLLRRLVSGQRFGRGILRVGDGVADAHIVQVFDGGDDETDLAGADSLDLLGARHELAQVGHLVQLVGAHEADLLSLLEFAIDHAHVGEHAAIVVVDAVENQRARRCIRDSARRRKLIAELVDQFVDPLAGLGADEDGILGAEAEHLLDFLRHAHWIGAGQVDLVDDGNDLQSDLDRSVGVGDGLRLHALRGIDDQDRPFAGLERLLHFVVKVDVAGRVDEVQHELLAIRIFLALVFVEDGDGAGLDGDAALAFQVHVVEHLVLKFAFGDGAGAHEQAIGERALAVVDVGDDGEIANLHVEITRFGSKTVERSRL